MRLRNIFYAPGKSQLFLFDGKKLLDLEDLIEKNAIVHLMKENAMLRNYCTDLKRAVEDVILKPDENQLANIGKRSTIAALDLCQIENSVVSSGLPNHQTMIATDTSCCGSSESTFDQSSSTTTTSSSAYHNPQLSMSTSLDTMVLHNSLSTQNSLGRSRRSSHAHPILSSGKRKRSNSVSSCLNKSSCLSITTPGGPLSLPPTARHTPMRFEEEYGSGRDGGGVETVQEEVSSRMHMRLTPNCSLSTELAQQRHAAGDIVESADEWQSEADLLHQQYASNKNNNFILAAGQSTQIQVNGTAFSAYRESRNSIEQDESMDCD